MTEAQGWVHHDCPDPGHGPGKGRIIKVCARLAEGKGEADRPAAAPEDDVSADRLKNAAATKKLAIFDAFEILNRIQEEENLLEGKTPEKTEKKVFKGFAEGRSK